MVVKIKTFDKNGWEEKELALSDIITLRCECEQFEIFSVKEVVESQTQEKYYFCDCDRQHLIYVKVIK